MRYTLALAILVNLVAAGAVRPQGAPTATKLAPLPRDLEIQLALSALPPHLRDQATVYVLNPDRGFEVARRGTNGFHALVARTGDDAFHGSWRLTSYRDDILYPISFDEAGAAAQMRIFLDAATLQARGTPPVELKRIMQHRERTGYYRAPARAGVSYMLSPILRTYTSPDQNENVATANLPHVMYYAPEVTGAQIGAATPSADELRYLGEHGKWRETPGEFLILHGPHGYVVQFRGVTERDAITKEYEGMLARLCGLRGEWCLPK